MKSIFQTAFELLIQITLWSGAGLFLLILVSRYFPRRLASVSLCFLAGVVALSVLIWVPWPSWVLSRAALIEPTAVSNSEPVLTETTTATGQGFDLRIAWQSWMRLMPALTQPGAANQTEFSLSWPWCFAAILVLGILSGSFRMFLAFIYARRQVHLCHPLTDPTTVELNSSLSQELKISVPAKLLVSPILQVPATVGYWKPAILLPTKWATWSLDELRAVLAHELAHIRRTDYLMMVLAQFITIVYWFHPLVRWLSRSLRSGQELAADALAVQALGDQATYLRSLCRLALDQDGARLPAPARLFLSPEVSLLRRVAMLREGSPQSSVTKSSMRWIFVTLLLTTGAFVASLRNAVVADEPSVLKTGTTVDWQRYVDANASGYAVVYPNAALSLGSMQPHRESLNQLFKDKLDVLPLVTGMGVPLDAVECFAGPIQVQLRKNDVKGTGMLTVRGAYFRLCTGEAAETWIQHCISSHDKVEHALGTYYKSNNKGSEEKEASCYLRPDERTIVFAQSEKEAISWLAAAKKPVTLPGWMAGLPQDCGILTLAVNMQSDLIKKTMQQAGDGVAINPMFKPVYEHEGSLIATVLKEDELHFQLKLGCIDAKAAEKIKKQFDALCTLLKVIQVSGTTNANPEKEATDNQLLVDLMNHLKSSQVGSIVQFNTHCTLKLGDAVGSQMIELQGKMEKK